MNEDDFAIREAEEVQAEEDYFAARMPIDTQANRRIFEAGFIRGYDKVRPKHPHGLSDVQIDDIARNMPGGMDGFLKGWGWMQFARAIEEAQGIGV